MAALPPQAGLLEREREVELLRQAWRRARAGHGSAWFICAEAGGGKTRLLREATAGLRTLWGAAEPVAPPDPFLALVRAIPGFLPAATRAESVARAAVLLEEAAAAGPFALVLDDLHFGDEGTAAVLAGLADLAAARPWLILAAARPHEGPATLRTLITELVCQGTAQRLELEPLSRDAVAALVAVARGRAAGQDEVERIHRESGGNPWFAEALARDAGAMSAARDRILLRLDRLEAALPGACMVLASLAPAGEPLPHAVVARRFGGDGPALRAMLRELRVAGVLYEDDGCWHFRHELLRRAVLEEMVEAERRDGHRLLAEAMECQASGAVCRVPRGGSVDFGSSDTPGNPAHGNRHPAPEECVSAATIAMHYAAARDPRAAAWAVRAAEDAIAVDAHQEAMGQYARALSFSLPPAERRPLLRAASLEAHRLGRFDESLQLAEQALAIDGGEPEARSHLHQRAADAARMAGQIARAHAHMDAAERALAGRPASYQMGNLWAGRLLEAAALVEPERVDVAAERALAVARRLPDRGEAARLEVEVRSHLLVSLLDCGDPAGFALLESVEEYAETCPLGMPERAAAMLNAYAGAVLGLFHERSEALYARLTDLLRRCELGWQPRVDSLRTLELVQRGRYEAASALARSLPARPAGLLASVAVACADGLRELRAGSRARAGTALARIGGIDLFKAHAIGDLLRLEAMTSSTADLRALAVRSYSEAERHRYTRTAAVAAVALARAGDGAPPIPDWLAAESSLRVFWTWADGIARRDPLALRAVADRLGEMACPYEAALALRDAGDLPAAYHAFRALGAVPAREQTASLLRAAGRPIPRRPRQAVAEDGLTEAERMVLRLLVAGETNDAIALSLKMGVRTVEAHLTRLYQKTGCRGRAALATWWTQHESAIGVSLRVAV
jgi:DNA-binding CsgD family transcriptional regulator